MNINLDQLKSELEGLKKGERGKLVGDYAKTYGCSKATIYRALRRKFGPSKQVSGDKKINRELVREIAKIKLEGEEIGALTTGRRGERELSTEDAIDILVSRRQAADVKNLSVSSVNRILRQEMGFRQRDPKVRVEADWANQEHQIDFSRSKYFQIVDFDNERNDYILQVSGKELHYKDEDNDRFRLWVVQLKDSYSRVRLVRGYGARGESAQLGIEFLQWAYTREDDDNPMRYIPDMLKSDNGAFMKSGETRNLLRVLQIEGKTSKPFNKESQGKVESGFASVWRKFELKSAIQLGVGSQLTLTEYNRMAAEYLAKDMMKAHPVRKKITREMDYRISVANRQQREVNEDFFVHAHRTIDRVVKQTLTVSIDNVEYKCPAYAEGKKITIFRMLSGEMIGELQEEHKRPFTLELFEAHRLGDFENRPHASNRQKLKKEMKLEKENYRRKRNNNEFDKIRQAVNNSIKQKANTAWETPEKKGFDTEREARVYIGKRLPAGVSFPDVDFMFSGIFQNRPILKASVERIIKELEAEIIRVSGNNN